MTVVAAAMVAVSMARLRAIEHPHCAAATGAAHQSGQQGSAAAGRLAIGPALHMGILRDQLLVFLVLFPADIARVVIAQQDVPSGPQRPQRTNPVSKARPPRADLRSVRRCIW